jgi:hypothetical protein
VEGGSFHIADVESDEKEMESTGLRCAGDGPWCCEIGMDGLEIFENSFFTCELLLFRKPSLTLDTLLIP